MFIIRGTGLRGCGLHPNLVDLVDLERGGGLINPVSTLQKLGAACDDRVLQRKHAWGHGPLVMRVHPCAPPCALASESPLAKGV